MKTLIQSEVKECEVGEIIHDISNAMIVLKSMLYKIQSCRDPELCHDKIKKALERVELTEEYLIAKKNQMPHHEQSDLAQVLDQRIGFFQGIYSEIDITLSIHASPKLSFDTPLFFNALTNLVKNSIEAQATKFHIEVFDNEIRFTDNGPGVSRETLTRLKQEGSTKGADRGLGLKSVARFCHQTGWHIHLHNNHPGDYFDSGFSVSFEWNIKKLLKELA